MTGGHPENSKFEVFVTKNYISNLYCELDIITECKTLKVIVELAKVEEDLFDNICTFNEAVIVLERAHDTLVDAI